MSAFTLDLSQLRQGSSRAQLGADPPEVGLSPEEWAGRISGDFLIERSGERITVRGRVWAETWLECVRCLKRFELSVDQPLELFADKSGSSPRRDQEELERDEHMLFHDGRRLDITPQVRETLLLELPIAPHCREDCAGLCPRCGADLNDGRCACPDPVTVR